VYTGHLVQAKAVDDSMKEEEDVIPTHEIFYRRVARRGVDNLYREDNG
jgi:hypothetical protein